MKDYFRRLTVVNFIVTVLASAAAYYLEITTLMLFAGLVALFLLRFMLGKDKADRMRIWNMRRKVFADDKRLMWLSVGLNFIAPIVVGFTAFVAFGASYNNAIIWFLGATHLGALLTNWLIFPKLSRQIVDVFD